MGKLANARIAAAAGHPELAANATALADALVQLGAGLLTLGQREQAQGCLQAAAALWSVAAGPGPAASAWRAHSQPGLSASSFKVERPTA